ncbi:major facilitator superfamily domain-containing protein [Staphylotrichum tortipilum]|uniref:Major facilitator superfamily domain-containing protein n=1 Tax=Staphylotrichum tortipilum TaxID=2831512 RepID=A0AAN6RP31_9PEZI|nr:major facilitator superfamily domain-containing protein [Staphylotrichum longicolle]
MSAHEKESVEQHESTVEANHGGVGRSSEPQFDPVAEAKLRRKLDLFLVPGVALMYLFSFIDRTNIGNARLAGFEEDLGLSGNDYNMVLSVFYVAYAVCEMPSVLLCKYIGPAWFLPLTTLAFGAVTIGTAFCETRAQIIACRFLLGVFEAGMMPGVAYYFSRWYRHAELSFRLGMYMIMTPTAGAFGGLLASGILSLDHFGSLKSWRMIFAIEGIISSGLAIIMLIIMTDTPATARWLTAEEKELAVARVISERPAQTEVVDKMNWAKIKVGLSNPVTIVSAFLFFCSNVSVLGISFFMPTIVRTIYPGKTRVQQQLLTVPPYVVGAFCLITASYLATRLNRRQIFLISTAPAVMAGYAMLLGTTNANVRYAAVFLTASTSYFPGSLCNGQVSANTVSDTARSVGISLNVFCGYLGGLIATWTYLPWDGPLYPIGNGLNLAVSGALGLAAMGGLGWMKFDNKKRDQVTPAERLELLAGLTEKQTSELDWKHPDFRWQP